MKVKFKYALTQIIMEFLISDENEDLNYYIWSSDAIILELSWKRYSDPELWLNLKVHLYFKGYCMV